MAKDKLDAGSRAHVTAGRKLRSDAKAAFRADGMANVWTAMGTIADRAKHTRYNADPVLSWQTLENMYRGDGVARKIIDKITEVMTYRGYEIEGDTDGKLYALMEAKGLNDSVREMLRWSRLYGGALGVVVINDGSADLAKPLNPNRIRSVQNMAVWNRWRTWWSLSDAYTDPTSPKYMTPSKYEVIPLMGQPFKVHETRTLRMDGVPVPDRVRVQNLGWGDSVFQGIWEQLRQLSTVVNGGERIVDGFIQEVMSIKNLSRLLETDDGIALVKKRLELLDLSSSNFRTKLLDAELETYTKSASAVTGLAELIQLYMQFLCTVIDTPQSIFFGKSDSGMLNNGDNQVRTWYDKCSSEQPMLLTPLYTQLIQWIVMSGEYSGPVKADKIVLRYKPLWQMDELDDSVRRLNVAKADDIYTKMEEGLVGAEVLDSRFGSDHYSPETHLQLIAPEARKAYKRGAPANDTTVEKAPKKGEKPSSREK